MNKTVYKLSVVLSTLLVSTSLFAGEDATNNPIETGVSFLNIAPESRGSSLGDAGAATSPDVYSQYWNPAKYPFVKDEFGVGLSYTPWLRSLVNDIGLVDVTGFLRFDEFQTVSSSIRYFSMGDIQVTDALGNSDGSNIHPYELAVDFAYSRKFSDNWAGAVVFRYILSDIFNGSNGNDGGQVYAANSFAVDISSYYHKEDVYVAGYQSYYSFGVNISNLGRKLTYNKGDTRYFLPANLKLGGSYGVDVDSYNSLMLTVDLNKLLVPTPDPSIDDDDDNEYYNNMSSLEGVFKSFGDAPDGFSEEMREIMMSVGLEYVYDNTFAVRGGYFYENQYKGNREYFSLGAGFKMNVFSLDVSYLVPMDSASPLANTLRFSLSFGVDGIQKMFR